MASDFAVSEVIPWFERAERQLAPDKPFVVGPRTLTYGELGDQVRRLSALFRQLELRRDDRAIVATGDDIAAIGIFLALLRNGITAVMLNPQAGGPELQTLVRAADAKALFVDRAIASSGVLAAAARRDAEIVPIDHAAADQSRVRRRLRDWIGRRSPSDARLSYPAALGATAPDEELPADVSEAALAYILFTSGTTSRPKGVEITHRSLAAQMRTFVNQYGLSEQARLLNVLPLHHTDGLTQGVTLTLAAGATLFRRAAFRVDLLPQLLGTIRSDRITHLVTVPSVLALVANLGEDCLECFLTEDFRFIISTAAYLDKNLWRRFEEKFRAKVVNVYGLTETVCEALYCGPDEATRRIGTVGKPVDCEARIVDLAGRDVGPGATGELILRGDNVMRGYFRMPEETAAVLRDGWFYTGDLAAVDEDGFYRIVGRKKNVIITGGMNVYPEDVTTVLRSLPGVLDAVTFGMPDDSWGERVVSCVVPVPGQALSVEKIAAQFLERASREKLPLEIHIVDDLPRGPAGKVILSEVKEMAARLRQERRSNPGGRDTEHRVLEVAARMFKAERRLLSLDSDASNTPGWNSLAHVEFLLALESEFDLRLAPRDLMTIVSLGDAVRVVEAKLAEAPLQVPAACAQLS